MGMAYSTGFHDYLEESSSRFKFEYQELIEHNESMQKYVEPYSPSENEFAIIIEKITPQPGEPFAFFKWFYSGGFKIYEEYFIKLPEAFDNYPDIYGNEAWTYYFNEETLSWTKTDNKTGDITEITIADDIKSLFNIESRKVIKIFNVLWNETINKENFRDTFELQFNHISASLNLYQLINSETCLVIKELGKKLYYQFFQILKMPFELKLKEYPAASLLQLQYPKEEDLYDRNNKHFSFLFYVDRYTRPSALYELLAIGKFIEYNATNKEKFITAFSGKLISGTDKIQWLKYKDQYGPFTIIYFLINYLMNEKGLIKPEFDFIKNQNDIIITRIKKLFVDRDNKIIKSSTAPSLSQKSTRGKTPLENELVSLLSPLT